MVLVPSPSGSDVTDECVPSSDVRTSPLCLRMPASMRLWRAFVTKNKLNAIALGELVQALRAEFQRLKIV